MSDHFAEGEEADYDLSRQGLVNMHFDAEKCQRALDEISKENQMVNPTAIRQHETPKPSASTTIGVFLKGGARLYTYQCERPVGVGDLVNVKLPSNQIVTTKVEEVHERPQLSTKWDTKWAVVVKTKAQAEEDSRGVAEEVSDLSKSLGL